MCCGRSSEKKQLLIAGGTNVILVGVISVQGIDANPLSL